MSNTNTSGTKCPKCEATKFEYVSDVATNSKMVQWYLRCESCKTFIALAEFANVKALLAK